jgi:hypothetical protein
VLFLYLVHKVVAAGPGDSHVESAHLQEAK